MTAEEYIEQRLDDQIHWYDAKSGTNQSWFKRLRLAEIVAAALIPLLAGLAPESQTVLLALGILGAGVAVIAAALGLYQFEQRWIDYRTTSESLKKEKFLFLTASAPFDQGPGENFKLLVPRVETIISKENTSWGQQLTGGGATPEEG